MIVVVGGANLDVKARSTSSLVVHTSNPGLVSTSPGGVARNVAENLARLGSPVMLIASVGADRSGDEILTATQAAGVDVSRVRRGPEPTGSYVAVLDVDGELVAGVADMESTSNLKKAIIKTHADVLTSADLVVLDGNLRPGAMGAAMAICAQAQVPVVLDPVSVPKAVVLGPALTPDRPLLAITPNLDELEAISGIENDPTNATRSLHERGVELVWVRMGVHGSVLSGPEGMAELAPIGPEQVLDVTGAGDAMLAAFCHAIRGGATPTEAARYGHAAASLTVASAQTVRSDLTDALVRSQL